MNKEVLEIVIKDYQNACERNQIFLKPQDQYNFIAKVQRTEMCCLKEAKFKFIRVRNFWTGMAIDIKNNIESFRLCVMLLK